MLVLVNSSVHSEVIRRQKTRMNVTPLRARDRQGDGFFCTLLYRSILASPAAPWDFSSAMYHVNDLCPKKCEF